VGVATSDIVCSVHWLKHRQLGVMDKIYYSQVFPQSSRPIVG
jgi:type III secretory pathway lipoprotein EscJ